MSVATLRPPASISKSLLLHLFAAMLFYAAVTALVQPIPTPVPSIDVQVVEAPAPTLAPKTAGHARTGAERARSTRRAAPGPADIPLSALGLRYTPQARVESEGSRSVGVDFQREGRTFKLADYLFRQIDQHLSYPAEFKSRHWTGSVTAFIRLNRHGDYLENDTRYDATSNYFRVLVARTLRAALRDPVPPAKLLGEDQYQFECNFRFVEEAPTFLSMKENHSVVLENKLHFYRSMIQSKLNPSFGPFQGLSMTTTQTDHGAQAVPVAGFDALWLSKKISDAVSGKPENDGLEKYRDDPAW